MFLLQHIYKRDFIDVALLYKLRIVIFDYSFCIFHSDRCQGLREVGDWDGLNTEDIVGVKDSLEVISGQEGALGELIK